MQLFFFSGFSKQVLCREMKWMTGYVLGRYMLGINCKQGKQGKQWKQDVKELGMGK